MTVGGGWWPLVAVGRELPRREPPSARGGHFCQSTRAAPVSLHRDLCGNKHSPLAGSASWRAGGLLEQTEGSSRKSWWEDTQRNWKLF